MSRLPPLTTLLPTAAGLAFVGATTVAIAGGGLEIGPPSEPQGPPDRASQNAAWIDLLTRVHGLDATQVARVKEIVDGSELLSQGNPALTNHPMSRGECATRLREAGETWDSEANKAICGGPYMAPLYDPASQKPEDATSCIDRLEFPNVPCEYPVVWVRAKEAQELCQAVGKRLCDAHEWEGGCQGAMTGPDYAFDQVKGQTPANAQRTLRSIHNRKYAGSKRWSYGDSFQKGVCAQDSGKTSTCTGGSWAGCGSNTYPAGAFPGCQSPLGVGDINGNAAEHMNLPVAPDQMSSTGSTKLGVTEMKGSWFIWDKFQAHEDWCRWRAPYWHGGAVMSGESHRNYHLGFRCCNDVSTSADLP